MSNTDFDICTEPHCDCDAKIHVNRPRFSKQCRLGVNCNLPNCYFTHPYSRVSPERVHKLCVFGVKCSNPMCDRIHPEHEFVEFVSKETVCKFGSNCTDITCKRSGHDAPPAYCRNGGMCRNPKCKWNHEKKQELCQYGKRCLHGPRCWFLFHDPDEYNKFVKWSTRWKSQMK